MDHHLLLYYITLYYYIISYRTSLYHNITFPHRLIHHIISHHIFTTHYIIVTLYPYITYHDIITGTQIENELKNRAAAGERESNGLRGEVNQMAATLSHIRDELKNSEKNAEKNALENDKKIEKLEKEKEKLQKLLSDSNSSASNNNEKSTNELNLLKKKMDTRESEIKTEQRLKDETHKKAIEVYRDKHMTEMEAEKAIQNNIKAAAALKHSQQEVWLLLEFILY